MFSYFSVFLDYWKYKAFLKYIFFKLRRPLGESNLKYSSMERNLRRLLNNDMPEMPTSAAEISRAFENAATMDRFGFNLRSTERFYIDTIQKDPHYSFTLFASIEIIKMIEQHIPQNRRYLMDGTFDVTPVGCFSQLLIIHIEYENDVSDNYQLIKPSVHQYSTFITHTYLRISHPGFSCVLRTHDE